ncbi:MAG TPA: hypothetical protein VMZ06_01245 [Candidatus Bathyarchaeia archaeon]|nr:hypothetical protein [Candidatus Bathyarchaeia archaeon]
MSKRNAEYRTRDPKPADRDPDYGMRGGVPNMPELPQEPERVPQVSHIDHVPVIRREPIRCMACGELGIWRPGGTTVPNVSTGEMFRWRSCAHCRQTHYIARPMTAGERARHLAPVEVLARR